MPWFKVDDNLAFHAKVVAAGNPALGLWVRAGAWCAQQLTDGFIPDHMLAALGTKQQAQRLVDNRLWDRVRGGYKFHEWTERQPSKGEVEAERAAARDRMRQFRAKKKGAPQTNNAQVSGPRSPDVQPNADRTSGEVRETFGNPDPTRPDPTLITLSPDESSEADAPDGFDKFWDVYDKKVGKKKAEQKYRLALKKPGVTSETLTRSAWAYVARQKKDGKHPEFTKDPATWLNGEHWTDQAATASRAQDNGWQAPWVPPPCPPDIADDPQRYGEWLEEQRQARKR